MDRENYIAPIVESYIPDASFEQQQELTRELRRLFDALYQSYLRHQRFDSEALKMVESESPNQQKI
jgi:hypothetical protein